MRSSLAPVRDQGHWADEEVNIRILDLGQSLVCLDDVVRTCRAAQDDDHREAPDLLHSVHETSEVKGLLGIHVLRGSGCEEEVVLVARSA